MPTTILHNNFTGADAVHPAAYVSSSDPGAVGAHKFWVDTSAGVPYQLRKRNAGNTAWEQVGAVGISDPTTTRGDLITRGASALGRFALGTSGQFLSTDGTDPVWRNTAQFFATSGLTGATTAARFVGGTVSGAPSTGTFAVGDFVVDNAGKMWICTGSGTPGVWAQSGGGMSNPMTTNQDVIVGGASGTPARIGVGSNGQVLAITAGVVGWANSASGFTNPMSAIGDVITGGTSGAAIRLGIGANGQVLTVVGGQPGWANPTGGGGGGSTNNAAASLYLTRTCI